MLLESDGAQRFQLALSIEEQEELKDGLAPLDRGSAGQRIKDIRLIAPWVTSAGPVGRIAAAILGIDARPVRAILFDKNESANWALGWHQDRTVAVEKREDVPGFTQWTVKGGVAHVEPPFGVIERMITLRVHLDAVGSENAPLFVSPGTHRLGKISEAMIARTVERHGTQICLAEAGDIWAYRTAILHASSRSSANARRRVLQLDYSADRLPDPLHWQLAG